MKFLSEKQLESGDYEFECEFTDEEQKIFINVGVVATLKEYIQKEEKTTYEDLIALLEEAGEVLADSPKGGWCRRKIKKTLDKIGGKK